mgnify:CR=1 FL=1
MSGAKRRPCGLRLRVQLVEHDARLDRGPPLRRRSPRGRRLRYFEVSISTPAPMAWPACDVPPPLAVIDTPWRAAIVTACTTSSRVRGITTPSRLNLVHAGVSGVQRARHRIEADFAGDVSFEIGAKRIVRHVGCYPRLTRVRCECGPSGPPCGCRPEGLHYTGTDVRCRTFVCSIRVIRVIRG